jgi:hypothetical protein
MLFLAGASKVGRLIIAETCENMHSTCKGYRYPSGMILILQSFITIVSARCHSPAGMARLLAVIVLMQLLCPYIPRLFGHKFVACWHTSCYNHYKVRISLHVSLSNISAILS